jgi:hypothetical protein
VIAFKMPQKWAYGCLSLRGQQLQIWKEALAKIDPYTTRGKNAVDDSEIVDDVGSLIPT